MNPEDLLYKPGLLRGERFIVTGGGTGLGRAMSEAFLMLGADLDICGRRGGVVERTAAELMAAHGGVVRAWVCDIRRPDGIEAMLERIWSTGPSPTGLVNNAAGNFISRTEDLSPRAFDAIADIVLHGSFYMTEPPRFSRRLVGLSHAMTADPVDCA